MLDIEGGIVGIANASDVRINPATEETLAGLLPGGTSLTPSSPTFATVGTTSAIAVAQNLNRKGLILVNTSANTIYLGFGVAAVLGSGMTLYPHGVFNMDEHDFTTAAVYAIASAASSNLSIQQFT